MKVEIGQELLTFLLGCPDTYLGYHGEDSSTPFQPHLKAMNAQHALLVPHFIICITTVINVFFFLDK